ncbi:hypothetical protein [Chitinophaga sp. RAB17]|uniref:hypothetical protein n=1 Tax=Chitinophaga sp. RAB17 TaxID=3233049 RepID=UPI003F923EFF
MKDKRKAFYDLAPDNLSAMPNPGSFMQSNYFPKASYNGRQYPLILIPDQLMRPSRWGGTVYYGLSFPDNTWYFKYPVNYYPDRKSAYSRALLQE